MKTAKIIYSNGKSITTSINGTDAEIKDYYRVGRIFNLGSGSDGDGTDEDNMQTVVSCVIAVD